MEDEFNEIKPQDLNDNVFKLIGADWMLISAGNIKSFNMMTASWGALGVLWNLNVCICFIRPTRYTYEFMEKNEQFTLSFFDEKYRDVLNYCGAKSGRNVNKAQKTGLTPAEGAGSLYFKEARLVIESRKIYYQDIKPEFFIDKEIEKNYPKKDYHRMYIGHILKCLKKG